MENMLDVSELKQFLEKTEEYKISQLFIPTLQIAVPLLILDFKKMERPWYIDVVNACASFWTIPHNFFFRDSFLEKTNQMSAKDFEVLTFCIAVMSFCNKEYGITFCGLKFVGTPAVEFSPVEIKNFHNDVEFRRNKLKRLLK